MSDKRFVWTTVVIGLSIFVLFSGVTVIGYLVKKTDRQIGSVTVVAVEESQIKPISDKNEEKLKKDMFDTVGGTIGVVVFFLLWGLVIGIFIWSYVTRDTLNLPPSIDRTIRVGDSVETVRKKIEIKIVDHVVRKIIDANVVFFEGEKIVAIEENSCGPYPYPCSLSFIIHSVRKGMSRSDVIQELDVPYSRRIDSLDQETLNYFVFDDVLKNCGILSVIIKQDTVSDFSYETRDLSQDMLLNSIAANSRSAANSAGLAALGVWIR